MKQHHTDTAGIVGNRREVWQSQLANKTLERVHMHISAIPAQSEKNTEHSAGHLKKYRT